MMIQGDARRCVEPFFVPVDIVDINFYTYRTRQPSVPNPEPENFRRLVVTCSRVWARLAELRPCVIGPFGSVFHEPHRIDRPGPRRTSRVRAVEWLLLSSRCRFRTLLFGRPT